MVWEWGRPVILDLLERFVRVLFASAVLFLVAWISPEAERESPRLADATLNELMAGMMMPIIIIMFVWHMIKD